jgi:hypothetical protein
MSKWLDAATMRIMEDAVYQQQSGARAMVALAQLLENDHRPNPGLADLVLALGEKLHTHSAVIENALARAADARSANRL